MRTQAERSEAQKDAAAQRALAVQLTHNAREAEKRLERCRGQLAAAVAREERTLERNRAIYTRMRSAWAATKGSGRASGAVAAAARELRAVEIVGIYEHEKGVGDRELSRLAEENRALLQEVRGLQNKATLLARERGGIGAATVEVRPHLRMCVLPCNVVRALGAATLFLTNLPPPVFDKVLLRSDRVQLQR